MSRFAAARLALQRNRARMILVLGLACGALLVAAPLALFLSGGASTTGVSRDPEGVFTGVPQTGAGGSGTTTPGVLTESAQSPAPGAPTVDTAGEAVPAGESDLTGVGGDSPLPGSPGWTGAGTPAGDAGTAAGAPAPAGGGTSPAGGGGQAPQAPAPSGGGGGGTPPAQQQPAPQPAPEKPCLCETVTDAVDGVTQPLEDTVGGLLGQ